MEVRQQSRLVDMAAYLDHYPGYATDQSNVGIENVQQFGQMLLPTSGPTMTNPMAIQAQLRQMNPELSHEELVARKCPGGQTRQGRPEHARQAPAGGQDNEPGQWAQAQLWE